MKKLIMLFQLLMVIILVGTSVYATVNATLDLEVSTNTLKRGDEFTVTLSLKNVDSENKVKSISGYVNYDSKVIEEITAKSIVTEEDNTVVIGNEKLTVEDLTDRDVNDMPDTSAYIGFNGNPTSDNDTKIVIDFNNGLSEATDLITMKFKVKENATMGEIENAIEYKWFVITAGSEASEEISKNVSLTIVIQNDANNKDNTNINVHTNTANNTNTNTNKNTNTNANTNTNKNVVINNTNTNKNTNVISNTNTGDNTVSGTKIPAAGLRTVIMPIIVFMVLAYVSYRKYLDYKDV